MAANPASPADTQPWLLPIPGQAGHDRVAEVAIAARSFRLHSYSIPRDLVTTVAPGSLVRVAAGRGSREIEGICVRVSEKEWDHTRRPLRAAEAAPTWLRPILIELALWVSEYYVCPPWTTLNAIRPAALRRSRMRRVRYVRLESAERPERLSAGQKRLLDALKDGERSLPGVLKESAVSGATVRGLIKRGLVSLEERMEPVAAGQVSIATGDVDAGDGGMALSSGCAEDQFVLTNGQSDAGDQVGSAVASQAFRVFLLFGIPGSGKTEVYVRAARAAIAAGRQVIILIPEIALTTQLLDRLTRRFERVAVLHSALTEKMRRETLDRCAAGGADVIIGTRSAVFAPCSRLGLIIVDEEQETSFKSLAAPFYHARDVAIRRGQLEMCPVLLGSATPALETWHNAQTLAHYKLLTLSDRAPGARLPTVRVAPSGSEDEQTRQRAAGAILSPMLRDAIREVVSSRQQAVLLHNRRGYATVLRCAICRLVIRCERCEAALVYHQADRSLRCHRCGTRSAAPPGCPDNSCRGKLVRFGAAIQQLAEELARVVPAARVLRLDSDTMRHRNDYSAALLAFERREADILLGTQMVAKGLDFPGVSLVGVIDADAALVLPDFRAMERVFQLVVQVVGRAGRKEGASLAIIQAKRPGAPAITHALRFDYPAFAAEELAWRQHFGYPPFSRLARLVLLDERPHRAREEAERGAARLAGLAGRMNAQLVVEAATECAVARLREMHRWQILIRGPRGGAIQKLLHAAEDEKALRLKVRRLTIDVDPVDFM